MREPGMSRQIGAKSLINTQIVKLTSFLQKAFPLALCVGAMLFFFCLPASAEDVLPARDTVGASPVKSRWLDEHPKRLGLTYGADINLVANYIWRGLYVGGPSVQASANVGYGGLFVDMWWNVGSTDRAFQGFLP